MFKTSPERRRQVRDSKKKNAANYNTPEKIDRRQKQSAASAKRHRTENNERRNARRARNRNIEARMNQHNQLTRSDALQAGITIINARDILHDKTIWMGPGMLTEIRISKQADALIRAAREKPCPPSSKS